MSDEPAEIDLDDRTPAERLADERRPPLETVQALDAHYKQLVADLGPMPRLRGTELVDWCDQVKALQDWHAGELRGLYGMPASGFGPFGKPAGTSTAAPKAFIDPTTRQRRQDGLECSKGHDLRGSLPNGKPALYVDPKGKSACRWCKQEAADRFKAKRTAMAQ
jgi:hypothetical protein